MKEEPLWTLCSLRCVCLHDLYSAARRYLRPYRAQPCPPLEQAAEHPYGPPKDAPFLLSVIRPSMARTGRRQVPQSRSRCDWPPSTRSHDGRSTPICFCDGHSLRICLQNGNTIRSACTHGVYLLRRAAQRVFVIIIPPKLLRLRASGMRSNTHESTLYLNVFKSPLN